MARTATLIPIIRRLRLQSKQDQKQRSCYRRPQFLWCAERWRALRDNAASLLNITHRICLPILLLFPSAILRAETPPQREIAITIDDLPAANSNVPGNEIIDMT